MKENVGKIDRIVRSIAGPALIVLGYQTLGGNRGDLKGLATIVSGTALVESAITRVCPLNAVFGIDTRNHEEIERDLQKSVETYSEKPIDTEKFGIRAGF